MSDSFSQLPGRTKFAAAGAGLAVQNQFKSQGSRGNGPSIVFSALMLLALTIAITAIIAILAWAFFEGRTRLDMDLIFNGPSTVNKATAGYSVAILGTLQIVGGVIALIVPLGAGAALYLEQFADKSRWWNRLIELNIQNLAGVPSIVFGILGLAFFVRAPFNLGLVAAAGSATIALLVLPTVILASREAIKAVPPSILEGSLALGATRWQAVWRQVLPAAAPGMHSPASTPGLPRAPPAFPGPEKQKKTENIKNTKQNRFSVFQVGGTRPEVPVKYLSCICPSTQKPIV